MAGIAKARRKRRAFAIIWLVVMSRMRKAILVLAMALISKSACAFDPVTIGLASWFTTSIGMPVSYALGCAFAYSPGIRIFGAERAVYGLDWGSLACN